MEEDAGDGDGESTSVSAARDGDEDDEAAIDPLVQLGPPSTRPIGERVVELLWVLVQNLSTETLVGFGSFTPVASSNQSQSGGSYGRTQADRGWGGYGISEDGNIALDSDDD